MKLKFVKGWQEKIKRSNTIVSVLNTGLITSIVITGGLSIAAFAVGAGLLVGIDLGWLSSVAAAITQKVFKIFTVKQEKQDAIRLLTQSKILQDIML